MSVTNDIVRTWRRPREVIRDLLDRLPDTHVAPDVFELPPLDHEPLSEVYGDLKPIKPHNP